MSGFLLLPVISFPRVSIPFLAFTGQLKSHTHLNTHTHVFMIKTKIVKPKCCSGLEEEEDIIQVEEDINQVQMLKKA